MRTKIAPRFSAKVPIVPLEGAAPSAPGAVAVGEMIVGTQPDDDLSCTARRGADGAAPSHRSPVSV